MLRSLTGLLLLCGLLLAYSDASAEDPQDWRQYNYDNLGWRLNHGEISLTPENVPKLEEKWRFPSHETAEPIGIVHATPVVVDGFVYFGTTRTAPSFYKLRPSGKLDWQYEIESVITAEADDPYITYGSEHACDGVMNAALVDDNQVYFGTFGGQVICLDRFSGEELWKVCTKQGPFSSAHGANTILSSPIMVGDTLIVAGGGFEHTLGAQPNYPCCTGRGFVAAFDPNDGSERWVYDVGPEPQTFPEPLTMDSQNGEQTTFVAGPSTSSVWCTPSYDPDSNTLFFGTDTHNAPRYPTADDSRLANEYSSAVIAISASDGTEKWVRQLVENDVWNNSIPAYDQSTGQYKDLSIGDTPKIYSIMVDGRERPVLGVGCKNGSFYVLDRADGEIIHHTTAYVGAPVSNMTASKDRGILALPSAVGGLQTGCAFDGEQVYTNGIDWPALAISLSRLEPMAPPSGGRVTAIAPRARAERWRHERPRVSYKDPDDGLIYDSGDPVGSGIALAGGVAFFTTMVSGKIVAVSCRDGSQLWERELGPVWCGPSVSRGRVYVGSGNDLFRPWNSEAAEKRPVGFDLPLTEHGAVFSFGLPGADQVTGLPEVETRQALAIKSVPVPN